MNYILSKNLLILFLLSCVGARACFLDRPVTVTVTDSLPQDSPSLRLHCASGDNDLGYHTLTNGQNFHFKFCAFETTLFFCHLWWNGKDLAFDVFKNNSNRDKCPHRHCNWEAKADGIYLNGMQKYRW
ncbi:Plant self-incompatibility protein S1 family [Striga hermonthica]|uniref:S-protein homolog n=1 Tax=Striga hermonthica TaxID=68872 RepID=A0A9N7R8T6_STRHE|nr:Plant self-incompatibility protein S1 family [Striga hermonthica]